MCVLRDLLPVLAPRRASRCAHTAILPCLKPEEQTGLGCTPAAVATVRLREGNVLGYLTRACAAYRTTGSAPSLLAVGPRE